MNGCCTDCAGQCTRSGSYSKGDVVLAEVPVVLEGFDKPRLKAYPVYTVIVDKFEAIVQLGMANSRMKDCYDVDVLLSRFSLNNDILRKAIQNTFARRQAALPVRGVALFTSAFMKEKRRYWEQSCVVTGWSCRSVHGKRLGKVWKLYWVFCPIRNRGESTSFYK